MDNKLIDWAKSGDTDAVLKLGKIFLNGEDVEQDFQKAVEFFSKAAELDYPGAAYQLGKMYREGTGVEKDVQKALEYFKKAADFSEGNNALEAIFDMCLKNEVANVSESLDFVIDMIESKIFVNIYTTNAIMRTLRFGEPRTFEFTPQYKERLEMRRLLKLAKNLKARSA